MTDDDLNVHHTITIRVLDENGSGWEFMCESCGYHARYIIGDQSPHKLVILDPGDPMVRHASDFHSMLREDPWSFPVDLASEIPSDPPLSPTEEMLEDDSWLTPEIEAKLEHILSKLDL